MPNRDPVLEEFLSSVSDALAATSLGPEAAMAIGKIFNALKNPQASHRAKGSRLPVCDFLRDALRTARSASAPLARVANAFEALEPSLVWERRTLSGRFASDNFTDGHANAMIAGPKGLEDRDDVWLGVSLLAPDVRYPDHTHGPEEVYLVLSPGRFRHGDTTWFEPGIGGTLYNQPGINHAMASDAAPLFAIWCLWAG
jgi:hypothetical protein